MDYKTHIENVDKSMISWYRTQVKCSEALAEVARDRGDKQMEHYYTQEALNYTVRLREVGSGVEEEM
jgi:hypothetical protein